MTQKALSQSVSQGRTALGIELGSTRIKAVLIGEDHQPLAAGSHAWENRFEDGFWTYSLEDIWSGLQDCYQQLSRDVEKKFNCPLQKISAMGISGMMHGYMAFDQSDNLLTPFRTWRNTNTGQAAEELTRLFQFNIPLRWSIAHLHQAILDQEAHIQQISHLTTLAGYIHWKLSGQKVLGIGEASGMFPIDSESKNFDQHLIALYDGFLEENNIAWKLLDILPEVYQAGEEAGTLTEEGALLLDPSGQLQAGVTLCPPEGDAGTGMVATNSIAPRRGNVSAGTSVFAMIVLEKPLSDLYPEIDMVTTPTGNPVAMVHSNNCTSDLNAWVDLFREFADELGVEIAQSRLYEILFQAALSGDQDGGGLISYNYLSGEPITQLKEGRPLFVRESESQFTLANFMRVQLYSALGALKIGLEILFDQEAVEIEQILGHGGFFKTAEVGQKIMAAAMGVPVAVMETAGEGGAWGIALLAQYMKQRAEDESLEDYLSNRVFVGEQGKTIDPSQADVAGFKAFMEQYKKGLAIERVAVEALK